MRDQSKVQPPASSLTTGVIVTGGASGLSLASAEALAACGRAVAIWDIGGDGAQRQADRIAALYGVSAIGVTVDVRADTDAGARDAARAAPGSNARPVHARPSGRSDRGGPRSPFPDVR